MYCMYQLQWLPLLQLLHVVAATAEETKIVISALLTLGIDLPPREEDDNAILVPINPTFANQFGRCQHRQQIVKTKIMC